jgi:hypothetical protein
LHAIAPSEDRKFNVQRIEYLQAKRDSLCFHTTQTYKKAYLPAGIMIQWVPIRINRDQQIGLQ